MKEINPSVKESIIRTTNYLNDAATLYNQSIGEARKRILTPRRHPDRSLAARTGTRSHFIRNITPARDSTRPK